MQLLHRRIFLVIEITAVSKALLFTAFISIFYKSLQYRDIEFGLISLYNGLPNILLSQLQRVQNTAAHLISCVKRSSHVTLVLKKLHWLPVEYCLQFKILLQMYKTANGLSPAYFTDLISTHVPSRSLRSSNADLFYAPCTFSKYDRKFGVCGPLLWNNLPEHIKNADAVSQFKRLLKAHLFTVCFS